MDVRHLDQHAPELPQIAAWYHAAWGQEAGFSLDDELRQLQRAPDANGLPRRLVAFDGAHAIAVAQLKYREMDAFPQYPYWLGGVYVDAAYRGRGIAGRLLDHVLTDAATLGLGALYLQTEHLDGGLYARHGWQPVQEADSYGSRVLLMVRPVG